MASVASFFVSRIDTAVDKLIEARLGQTTDAAERLALTASGARSRSPTPSSPTSATSASSPDRAGRRCGQRRPDAAAAWASTGTKNPEYSDVLYVEELIGPDTINTMPLATMDAFRDHGKLRASLEEDVQGARQVMATLDRLGISIDEVTAKVLDDGIRVFADAMDKVLSAIAAKRALAASVRHCGGASSRKSVTR